VPYIPQILGRKLIKHFSAFFRVSWGLNEEREQSYQMEQKTELPNGKTIRNSDSPFNSGLNEVPHAAMAFCGLWPLQVASW
jgi:hypothetical protein